MFFGKLFVGVSQNNRKYFQATKKKKKNWKGFVADVSTYWEGERGEKKPPLVFIGTCIFHWLCFTYITWSSDFLSFLCG